MDVPWTPADVFFTFLMWAVMMVGMMAGTAAPVLLLFAAARAKRGEGGVRMAVLMFGFGYVLVWMSAHCGCGDDYRRRLGVLNCDRFSLACSPQNPATPLSRLTPA